MESKDSSSKKLKDYERRIVELERIVGQKQLKIDFLEKLSEVAQSDLGIDLKKNTESKLSSGSTKISKK